MTLTDIRIVFFGTSEFAVSSLDLMIKNCINVVGVVTVEDKIAGRGQKLQYSPVKIFALEHNLNLLQPANLKAPAFTDKLRELKADLQIIVAFRMLPEIVWNMPPLGTFNLHASLLPEYRGAAPINHAIINGEKETGITTFFLDKTIDTGKIILQQKISISDDETAGDLHDKLKFAGAKLVINTIELIIDNKDNILLKDTIPPEESILSDQHNLVDNTRILKTAPKIEKKYCKIAWNDSTYNIHNFIRGLSPHPCAFTELVSPDNKIYYIKIYSTIKDYSKVLSTPGKVVTDSRNYFGISTIDGVLYINELQLTGKKKLNISEFLRGFTLTEEWNICKQW